jgi:High potential iron-sulfur protein
MDRFRRNLIAIMPAAGAAVLAGRVSAAQPARADEKDPTAVALGYKHDASTVDVKKFPQFVKGNICANCVLYVGKPTDPWAACGALAGKLVNAKGWCMAFVKRS